MTFLAVSYNLLFRGRTILKQFTSKWTNSRGYQSVTSDVLLFKDDRTNYFRIRSIGTAFMGAASLNWGLTSYKGLEGIAQRIDRAKAEVAKAGPDMASLQGVSLPRRLWRRYKAWLFRFVSGDKLRICLTGVMCVFSALCFSYAIFLPMRCVHRFWLLKGGDRVGITTFGLFGIAQKQKVFPVNWITSDVVRKSEHGSIPVKVKGYYGVFPIDNRYGKILNKELFDEVVSVRIIFRKSK